MTKNSPRLISYLLTFIIIFGVTYTIAYKHFVDASTTSAASMGSVSYSLQSDISRVAQLSASLSKPTNLASITQSLSSVSVAKERKAIMLRLARKSPLAFLSSAISSTERATLPTTVQAETESDANLTGEITTIHIDDFTKPENSYFKNYLTVGNKRYELYAVTPIELTSGTEVNVNGVALENVLVAKAPKDSIKVTKKAPRLDSVGTQRAAVFLIDFLDSGPQPFTKRQAQDIIFKSQFNEFYKEQSYGKVKFEGSVFGWFTLQRNAPANGLACGAVTPDDISNIMAQNRINLNGYGRLVIIPSHPYLSGGCSGVGKSNTVLNNTNYNLSTATIGNITNYDKYWGWGTLPFAWTNIDYILSHELGHSLGVMHANGWDCNDQSLYNDCHHLEYGNHFDTMGTGSYSLHFNALYKELLGWFSNANVLVVKTGGTKSLTPIEISGTNDVKVIKIQQPNTTEFPYYVEYRKAIGFDKNLGNPELTSNQSGVFINNRIEDYFPFPRLIDASPTGDFWFDDTKKTTLNSNLSFKDPGRGITITTDSVSGETAKITTKFTAPECVRKKPQIQDSSYPYWVMPKDQYAFMVVNFTNGDYYGCGPSIFVSTLNVPEPLKVSSSYPDDGKSTVTPGDNSWYSANIEVPANTPEGHYVIHYSVTNATDSSLTDNLEFTLRICEVENCSNSKEI